MQRQLNILSILLFSIVTCNGQQSWQNMLDTIAFNNPEIRSVGYSIAADSAFLQTGLSLPDPELVVDWMQGFPSSAGAQTDLTASQSFDFPSAYQRRRELANKQASQLPLTAIVTRQEVLLQAKSIAIEFVYLTKYYNALEARQERTSEFLDRYTRKFEQQDATILELNKARLALMNVNTDIHLVGTERTAILAQLEALNGGITLTPPGAEYPALPDLESYDSLIAEVNAVDPQLARLRGDVEISVLEKRVTQAMVLPRFDIGYRYQGLLGQNFHGVHTGVSVPLWENRKRIAHADLSIVAQEAKLQAHRIEFYANIEGKYREYETLLEHYLEYKANIDSLADPSLLEKALEGGQITAIEYFIEISAYDESTDRYLRLEAAVQRLAAELTRHRL